MSRVIDAATLQNPVVQGRAGAIGGMLGWTGSHLEIFDGTAQRTLVDGNSAAGGDLGGTYPNPTVLHLTHVSDVSLPSGIVTSSLTSLGTLTALTLNGLADFSGASGGQIKFPATQNASADVNTLDDYKEGTWTPSVGGTATYTKQIGHYVKIGRWVLFHCTLVINAIGTGSTSSISGAPYTANNTASMLPFFSVGYASLAINSLYLVAYISNNSTTFTFQHATAAAASLTDSPAVLGSGSTVRFNGAYETTG